MHLDMDFFGFACLKFTQLIYRLVFYPFGKFIATTFKNTLSVPFSFSSSSGIPMIQILDHFYVSQVPESLLMFLLLLLLFIFYCSDCINYIVHWCYYLSSPFYNWAHPSFFTLFLYFSVLYFQFGLFLWLLCLCWDFLFFKLTSFYYNLLKYFYDTCLKSLVS